MASHDHIDSPSLYPDEVLDTIGGFPTIYHYTPSPVEDKSCKPLIVLIPGAVHLARIFYGGHEGHRREDFLVHWLNKVGFGVLSLSYPLETSPSLMPATGSSFSIADWGRQAALTAQLIIDRHSLSTRSVILASWSMGGRVVVQFNIACKQLNLNILQYISLAATPGISGIRSTGSTMDCTAAGYFGISQRVEAFYKQLVAVNEANHDRKVIPRETYLREYVGATPINLIGLGLKYDAKSTFIKSDTTHEEDSRIFDIENIPFISALYPTSAQDSGHALTDKATWGFLMTYQLESMIPKERLKHAEGTLMWDKLRTLFDVAPSRMSRPIPGNHFFFVGEKGARETSDQFIALMREGTALREELTSILTAQESKSNDAY